MGIINIEEIRASDRLKEEKCSEAKAAIRDILSDDQLEKYDGVFEAAMDIVFKDVMLK